MRLVARGTSERPPRSIWQDLADPRQWDRVLRYPDMRRIRRVKHEGGPPAPGTTVQVLFEDLSWTRHTIVAWQPEKRIEFIATEEGHGESAGEGPAVPWSERLILIPQGSGAEMEWSVRFHPHGLGRLVAPLAVPKDDWKEALKERCQATA